MATNPFPHPDDTRETLRQLLGPGEQEAAGDLGDLAAENAMDAALAGEFMAAVRDVVRSFTARGMTNLDGGLVLALLLLDDATDDWERAHAHQETEIQDRARAHVEGLADAGLRAVVAAGCVWNQHLILVKMLAGMQASLCQAVGRRDAPDGCGTEEGGAE